MGGQRSDAERARKRDAAARQPQQRKGELQGKPSLGYQNEWLLATNASASCNGRIKSLAVKTPVKD